MRCSGSPLPLLDSIFIPDGEDYAVSNKTHIQVMCQPNEKCAIMQQDLEEVYRIPGVNLDTEMDTRCKNCGILIDWKPTVVDGHSYCCLGCAVGGPCSCDYSNLPSLEESFAIVRAAGIILLGSGSCGPEGQGPSVEVHNGHQDDYRVA